MPNCFVLHCKNRVSSGFKLFRLPSSERNAERRQLWSTLIARSNLPRDARICECHFSDEQFESGRMDGKKMLRPNAFPDLLQVEVSNSKRKRMVEEILPGCSTTNTENTFLEDSINDFSHETEDSFHNSTAVEESLDDEILLQNESLENNIIENLKKSLKSALRKCRNYENMLKTQNPTNLEKNFNKDQLEYLGTDKHKGTMWSEETITNGLKLYMACGTEGYNEILRQKLPYPSIRTLQHRLRNLKFNAGILED